MADVSSIKIGNTTYQVKDTVARERTESNILVISVAAFSAFPKTVNDSRITADHVLLNCSFGNEAAITSDVTWTTNAGNIVLRGTIEGETTAQIVLGKSF